MSRLQNIKQRFVDYFDARQKAKIARIFNDRYAYCHVYDTARGVLPQRNTWLSEVEAGYAWMCPECNRIHNPVAYDGLVGLIYPKCCLHGRGHRLHDGIKTQ